MSKQRFLLACAAVAACAGGASAQTTYYLTPTAPAIPFASGVAAGAVRVAEQRRRFRHLAGRGRRSGGRRPAADL